MKYLNNFLLLCDKDTSTSGVVKKKTTTKKTTTKKTTTKKTTTKKKIENYTVTPEVVEIKKNEEAFDYDNAKVILDVKHLKQFFRFGKGELKYNKAVNNVSFQVYKGEVFGLVGESGCGKTTIGRSIIKLYQITSGDVWFDGVRISAGTRWNEKEIKFTKIRLKEALKSFKAKKQSEIATLSEEYFENYNEVFNERKVAKEVKEENTDTYEDKNRYLVRYREIVEKYKNLENEEIEKATVIIKEQRQKIIEAKRDNKYCGINYDTLKQRLDAGEITLEEYKDRKRDPRSYVTSNIQMIFQDPIASLNPRMTVRNIIAEGLIIKGVKDQEFITKEVNRVLELVGLLPEHANRYPLEFYGGQRQSIGIARAIIMNPQLIIADAPVSALDVSIQAQVINLLNELRNELGLTVLFIAHNLSVVKYFCDRIAVMYFGNIVELATSEELFANPLHPYTKALLSAVPHPDPNIEKNRQRIVYNARETHDYSVNKPSMREISKGHFVFCNDEEELKYKQELESKNNG